MSLAMPKKLSGVYAAVLTPLSGELRPDLSRFVDHCKHLLQGGCDGLAPLGTTGEANSIAVIDRIALIEASARVGLPMERMIVGTGTPALHDTVALSRAALEAGAGGILVLPPFYYKEPSEDGLYAAYAGLAERIGDLDPRIYLYHIPQMSTVAITLALTRRLREAFPGMFAGLKDSSGDFANTRAFIEAFPGFSVFSGTEERLRDNLQAGGVGCISATTNVTAHLAQRVVCALQAGAGEAEQAVASAARQAVLKHPGVPALKAIVAHERADPAWRNVLPPLQPLSAARQEQLFADLSVFDGFADLKVQAAE